MKYFENFIKGSSHTSLKAYEVREEEIIEVATRWDPQVFHMDPEKAKDSIFGGLVASTTHMFAIYSWLGNTQRDEEEIATISSLGYKNMQWHLPVRPGDKISMKTTITNTRISKSRPDSGIVEMKHALVNQNDEMVFSISDAFMVYCDQENAA